jgi:hypothetical protein
MPFSLLPILRRLQSDQVREYLASLDRSLLELVDWRLSDRRRVPALRDAIDALPEAERRRIHDDLEHVAHLATDFGQQRLHEALRAAPELLAKVEKLDGAESRALCALMEAPSEAIEAAGRAYLARLQYGKSWSRFRAIGAAPLAPSDSQVVALSRRLQETFARLDGSVSAFMSRSRTRPTSRGWMDRRRQRSLQLTWISCRRTESSSRTAVRTGAASD